jgi:hypothetical protein
LFPGQAQSFVKKRPLLNVHPVRSRYIRALLLNGIHDEIMRLEADGVQVAIFSNKKFLTMVK